MKRWKEYGREIAEVHGDVRRRPVRTICILVGLTVISIGLLFGKSFVEAVGGKTGERMMGADQPSPAEKTPNDSSPRSLDNPTDGQSPRALRPADVIEAVRRATPADEGKLFDSRFLGRTIRVTLSELASTSGAAGNVQGQLTLRGRAADGTLVIALLDEKYRDMLDSVFQFDTPVAVEGVIADLTTGSVGLQEPDEPILQLESCELPNFRSAE